MNLPQQGCTPMLQCWNNVVTAKSQTPRPSDWPSQLTSPNIFSAALGYNFWYIFLYSRLYELCLFWKNKHVGEIMFHSRIFNVSCRIFCWTTQTSDGSSVPPWHRGSVAIWSDHLKSTPWTIRNPSSVIEQVCFGYVYIYIHIIYNIYIFIYIYVY